MYKSLFVLVFALFSITLVAQKNNLHTQNKMALMAYDEALKLFKNQDVNLAIGKLEYAIRLDKNFIEAYLMKADLLNLLEDYDGEIEMLKKAITVDSTFFLQTYNNLGKACYNQGNFVEARFYLNKYIDKRKDGKLVEQAKKLVENTYVAEKIMANPLPIHPQNLGKSVNSEYDEYWPSMTADGQTLVLTVLVARDRDMFLSGHLPKSSTFFHEDFYQSNLDANQQWKPRVSLPGAINTDNNEGAQTLSPDGKWMFFAACGRPGGLGSCDIWFSTYTASGWSSPINVGAPLNTPYWESQPSFSADGKTLFYSSGRPDGLGKKDIWKAEIVGFKDNGCPIFSTPINLGSTINTAEDEQSPFIHADSRSLYFSSNGWPGLGRMDLFVSRLDTILKTWKEPVNLGYPINSSKDEIGLIINTRGDKAYFASDGVEDNNQGKDIYCFDVPPLIRPNPVSYFKGRVFDADTKELLEANFELFDVKTKRLVVESQSTGFTGQFLVCLPIGFSYALNVNKPGYLFYSGHFDMTELSSVDKPTIMDVYLKKIKIGQSIVLNNIFFDTDSYQLKEDSYVELQKLLKFLTDNPSLKIELSGHTDNQGTVVHNQTLSTKRAQAIYNFLIKNGVAASRLTYKGYASTIAIADNSTEEGRAKNRRTEFKVIE